jgi:hypothetical protein
MIGVFGDHRLHHHAVASQSLFHDARSQWGHGHGASLTAAAGPLFALGHAHEVARRLDIHLFALVVADHRRLCPALPAGLLRAADYFLDTRQILRQALPPWMRTPLARRDDRERSAPCFRLHLIQCGARLFIGQQLELQIAQGLAARPQQFHPLLPQFFRQRLDFQMRPG